MKKIKAAGGLLLGATLIAGAALLAQTQAAQQLSKGTMGPVFCTTSVLQPFTTLAPGESVAREVGAPNLAEGQPCFASVSVWNVGAGAPDAHAKLIISCRVAPAVKDEAAYALVTFKNEDTQPVAIYQQIKVVIAQF